MSIFTEEETLMRRSLLQRNRAEPESHSSRQFVSHKMASAIDDRARRRIYELQPRAIGKEQGRRRSHLTIEPKRGVPGVEMSIVRIDVVGYQVSVDCIS